jgi:S-adenosylmethionine synthetase
VAESLINGEFEDPEAPQECTLSSGAPEGWNYEETASYGHFGRDQFPWEKTDKSNVLKQVFKKIKAA